MEISASILSADFARLGAQVDAVLDAGADSIHFDVMDHHYVPNLTIGPMVCKALRDYGVSAPIDVHLMVKPVDALIGEFAKAGATAITFHPEATEHVDRSLQLIKDNGCLAGLALNIATILHYLDYETDKLDQILVMSVNPGFGGQKFLPKALDKIRDIRKWIDKGSYPIKLAVDGGINSDNIQVVAEAGADMCVIGSAIFNTPDYAATIARLRHAVND